MTNTHIAYIDFYFGKQYEDQQIRETLEKMQKSQRYAELQMSADWIWKRCYCILTNQTDQHQLRFWLRYFLGILLTLLCA